MRTERNVRRLVFLDNHLHEAKKVCTVMMGECHLAAILVAVDDARHWEPPVQDLIRLQLGRLQRQYTIRLPETQADTEGARDLRGDEQLCCCCCCCCKQGTGGNTVLATVTKIN